MKRYFSMIIALLLILTIAACGKKNTVPTFEEAATFTEEDFKLRMEGIHVNEVTAVWGKSDNHLSGMWGDIWLLEEAHRFVTLYYDANGRVEDVKLSEQEDALEEEEFDEIQETPIDLIPMVMVDGKLYLDTGKASTVDARCGVMDGEITSSVAGNKKPTKDNQSNFGSGYSYQYGPQEGCIEIFMNDEWFIFATEEVREEILFPDVPFKLLVNDEEIKPYKHFLNSQQWTEDGWLCGDGMNLANKLPDIMDELAAIIYGDDMEIVIGENTELLNISIMDENLESLEKGTELSVLEKIPTGSYILSFTVKEQGKYIETENDYESSSYSYIYKLEK